MAESVSENRLMRNEVNLLYLWRNTEAKTKHGCKDEARKQRRSVEAKAMKEEAEFCRPIHVQRIDHKG